MNINRDNYEEFFLLYADNELSVQEKNAVEDFVRQHPDLEEELVSAGFPIKKEQRAFHPHITIANRDLQKKDFKPAWEMFSSKTYHADFVADAITILQHDGVQWNIIFRAPFKS